MRSKFPFLQDLFPRLGCGGGLCLFVHCPVGSVHSSAVLSFERLLSLDDGLSCPPIFGAGIYEPVASESEFDTQPGSGIVVRLDDLLAADKTFVWNQECRLYGRFTPQFNPTQ